MDIKAKQPENISPLTRSIERSSRFWRNFIGHKKAYLIVTLAVLIAIGFSSYGVHSTQPSYAYTSKCTLNIINGSVDITIPGNIETQPGINGMTLDVGYSVKTSPDSAALLTFFDGSTLTLQPNTDVEIEQLELNDNQQTITIVLKQWTGNTWSHVVKMADLGSHYEIKTPSAVALVRGTQFLTEVNELGATKILTAEGLVSVRAQGTEIFLPVGQQTNVEPGTSPSNPTPIDVSEYVKEQEKLLNKDLHSQSNSFKDSSNFNSDFINKQNNSNNEQSLVTVKDSDGGRNNGIGIVRNQAVKSNQNQNNSQDKDNSNNNGNANGQSEDNSNNNRNANGQSDANSSNNGNANGQSDANSNNNGNANGQSDANSNNNGNANGQSDANSNNNGNANGQSDANSNNNGNANGQSEDNSSNNGNANGQSDANSNNNGNANGQSEDNSNNNGNANGQSEDNSSNNGNANGQSDTSSNNNGNPNGQSDANSNNNGNANGQSEDNSNNNGNANGQSDANSNNNGNANGQSEDNANNQNENDDNNRDKTAVPPTPTPNPTPTPPSKSDKDKPDKDI